MEELVSLLQTHHLTIASCESLTAGLFASNIASVPGASKVLLGGLITYQDKIKEMIAHVSMDVITTHGVISEACAYEMAKHTYEQFRCDIAVSFTGNAGPDAQEGKPVGLVYCAIATMQGIEGFTFQLAGTRNEIRNQVVKEMETYIIKYIRDNFKDGGKSYE